MEDWKEYKLGDIYEVHNGLSKGGKFFGSGYPFLSFSTVFNKWFLPAELSNLVQSTEKEQESFSIKKGDVFITRTSETAEELGMSCVALKDYPNATYNGFCKRMRQYNSNIEVDPKYVGYYLRNPNFRLRFQAFSGSMSTRASLTNEALLGLPINLPPLSTQQKIVEVLSSLDDKIELNNKINDNLEQQAQAIFKSWFVDFEPFGGEMPEGWKEIELGNICNCELGGTPNREKKEYWSGNIPWINSGEVNLFRIIEPSEYITKEGLEHSSTKLLPKKTIVIAITGATLGQISLLEIDSCANQSVVGVIPNEKLPYGYLYPMINNRMQELISHQTGGAQQHINKQNVQSLMVNLPEKKILEKYKQIVEPIYENIANNCFENKKLSILRDSLLPKLMNGEINV